MMLGTSDLWIRLNAFLWSTASVLSLFLVIRTIFTRQTALFASLFLAWSPFSVWYAQEVRAYSWLMFLGLWVWFFTHHFLHSTSDTASRYLSIGILGSTCLFLYSHATGFLILCSTGSYALIALLLCSTTWNRFKQWLGLQFVIGVLYIPWVYRALQIKEGPTELPDIAYIVKVLSIVLWGFAEPAFPWLQLITPLLILLTGLVVLIYGFKHHAHTFNVTLSFVFIPTVFCLALSYLIKPIWGERSISYTTPYILLMIGMVIALLCEARPGKSSFTQKGVAYGFLVTLLVVFSITLYQQKQTYSRPWIYNGAVDFVKENMQHGDIIFIPYDRDFYVWCWYFIGPGSIEPLTTDFEIQTQGVEIISLPVLDKRGIKPGQTYWLIGRNRFAFDRFDAFDQKIQKTIKGIHVEKVYVPEEVP